MFNKLKLLIKTIFWTIIICVIGFTVFYSTYIITALAVIGIVFIVIKFISNIPNIIKWLDEEDD